MQHMLATVENRMLALFSCAGLMEGAMRIVAPLPSQPAPTFFPDLPERQAVIEGLSRWLDARVSCHSACWQKLGEVKLCQALRFK
jgi:hypothetical protein